MSLETRVETLEHEFKILKNEIESTLLEIQNQVLIHYYPSLRAAESTPPKDLLPIRETATPGLHDEPQRKENAEDLLMPSKSAPPPKTKETSLTETLSKAKAPPVSPPAEPLAAKAPPLPAKSNRASWPPVAIDQAALPFIARWVNESVEKIGKELTQNMVASSANADLAAPELTALLLQFITLCDEEQPPEQVDTSELMDMLLKLNKMLDHVEKLMASATATKVVAKVAAKEAAKESIEELEVEAASG